MTKGKSSKSLPRLFIVFLIFSLWSPLWNNRNKSCLNELKFWEASENHKSSICWKCQLSISCGTQKSAKIPLPVAKIIWSFLGRNLIVLSLLNRVTIWKHQNWYKLDRSGGSYLIHEGCSIIQTLLRRMFRVGKKGSLGPWSRVMVCYSKPSFCQNDPPIGTRWHTRFSELPTSLIYYLLCTPNLHSK